ncbi:MAG: hypothetical protein Q4E43_02360 [Akkermansia sp.]|nr:hypothetical protein [Akkermansia sp.]
MDEETIINLLLDLTNYHGLSWYKPIVTDGTEVGGTFERYCTKLPKQNDLLFVVGKSLIYEDLYSLVCHDGKGIAFSVVSKEMKNKYLLRSLYDTASEIVRKKILNRVGEILQGQINNNHAQTDLKSSSDDNTKSSS